MKKWILIALFLFATISTMAQTPVDAFVNMNNVSPASPGTAFTSTIMTNGTVGSLLGSPSFNGSASSFTVGSHLPECTLGTSITAAGQIYTPASNSQSINLSNASGFQYMIISLPGTSSKMTWSGCVHIGSWSGNFSVLDLWRINMGGNFVIMQQSNSGGGATTCLRIEVNPNPTSGCITVNQNTTYWCSLLDDGVGGTAQLACYLPYAPFTQVGSTQTHSQATGTNIDSIYFGNSQGATASTTTTFENMIFAYASNAVFPTGVGTLTTPWAGIISPTRAIDWSQAGVVGGIPTRNTQCGATVAAYTGTAATINSAIAACPTGQFVGLGSGTFNLSSGVDFTGHPNVTLRGQGASQTLLVFTGNVGCNLSTGTHLCVGSVDNNWKGGVSNSASWTAGYLPGTTQITLSAVPNLKIGNPLMLDQLDDDQNGCDAGGIFVSQITTTCTVGSPTSPGVNGPYSLEGNNGGPQRSGRQQSEVHIVAGCNGSTTPGFACSGTNVIVTISEPLEMPNWRSGQTPQAWWSTSPLTGVGIEDLSYDSTGDANGTGINFKNATNSWVKGVRGIDTNRAHVQVYLSSHITVTSSYFFLTQNSATQSYGYECFTGAYDLVTNNIYHAVAGPVLQNGACIGDVVAYNFAINNFYTPSAGWNQPGMSVHTAGNDFALYEGNVFNMLDMDVFHGTHHFITVFRNRYAGTQPACFSSGFPPYSSAVYQTCNNDLIAIQVHAFSRFVNLVGNVLGTSGVTTVYSGGGTGSVYVTGNGNSNGTVTVPGDSNATSTLMRWGNWDSVNASNQFNNSEVPTSITSVATQQFFANPIPANQTLPSSLFLTSKPSFWPGAKPWPGIGPDITGGNISGVGGHAYTVPAQDCYLSIGGLANGTGGVLPFDENTCYLGGIPIVGISPSPVPFGSHQQGTTSAPITLTVSNTGTAPLLLSTPYFTITGTNSVDFTNTNNGTCSNGSSIIAGNSCTVTLTYSPTSMGSESASFNIVGNANGSAPLTGSATAPSTVLKGTGKLSGSATVVINP